MLLPLIDRERAAVLRTRAAIHSHAEQFLAKLRAQVAAAIRERAAKVSKALDDDDGVQAVNDADWSSFHDAVQPELAGMAKDAARQALRQVGVGEIPTFLEQVNARAVKWSEKHAAKLVTEIRTTTRERVRELVTGALEQGMSNDALADEIQDEYVFSAARAETIARTETAFADVNGNLVGWKDSGVVAGKEWRTSQGDPCEECAALEGEVVALDEEFPGGDPPLHPRCECDLLPVLAEPEGGEG